MRFFTVPALRRITPARQRLFAVMNSELLLTALGALLVLTAIVGGGLEVREFKIPKIGRVARGASGIAGLLCILFAISLASVAVDDPGPVPMVVHNVPADNRTDDARPVKVRLHDELGEGQISEQVSVVFDGRNVGDIKVNADFPDGMIEVTAPKPGAYDYTLSSVTEEVLSDGSVGVIQGAGQGRVTIDADADFAVSLADSGNGRALTLVAG
jgi:hypothetical protein